MKLNFIKTLAVSALIAGIAGLFAVTANAQQGDKELSSSQIESVRNNCVTAQASLQRLRDSDLIARTIRGRTYNDLNELIKSFNSRIALNGVNAPNLIAVPATLDQTYRDFYDHYTNYDASMRDVLDVDCKSQPERFYTLFLNVEQQRERIADDISSMRKQIDSYRQSVTDLRTDLRTEERGGGSR